MQSRKPRLVTAFLALTAFSCMQREVVEVTPVPEVEVTHVIPATPRRAVDILFVIDNSGSMAHEQDSLGANFQRFIDVLEGIEGGLPDVHIGVTSTDVGVGGLDVDRRCDGAGDAGRLLAGRERGCAIEGSFLRDVATDSGRQRNYTGSLQEAFACMAELGTEGCGLEQHWEAMRQALDDNPANAGFVREDAYLAVVFVSDEDDCSAFDPAVFDRNADELGPISLRCAEYGVVCEGRPISRDERAYENCAPRVDSPYLSPPDDYAGFLRGLKPDPYDVIVAAIIGDPTGLRVEVGADSGTLEPAPSCESSSGRAAPGIRVNAFLERFPDRNTITSICDGNLSGALDQIAKLLAYVFDRPCLQSGVDRTDLDPDAAGLQVACSVSDVRFIHTDSQTESLVPACAMNADGSAPAAGPRPCWWVEPNTAECGAAGLLLHVERERPAPSGTQVVARCEGA